MTKLNRRCTPSCVLFLLGGGLGLLVTIVSGFSSIPNARKNPKVLVLGTGFVGSQIVSKLKELDIEYKTASRSGAIDYQIDLLAPDAEDRFADIAKEFDAVISTVGSIGDPNDEAINAATGRAAVAAKRAGVKRFVYIGNEPRVRDFSKSPISPLKSYAAGKEQAEEKIRASFPNSHTIIQPSFIYGGDDFSLSPPRIPSNIGQVAEDVLGLYPFQAASNALPGVFGLVLGAPISRERVAAAAVNAALGSCDGDDEQHRTLASRDEIIAIAAKRPIPVKRSNRTIAELKEEIYKLGDCQANDVCLADAYGILEEVETLRTLKPATDPALNGRWDFCFDVEADLGTGVIKDILEGNSPIKPLFNLQDLHMTIKENRVVNIMVHTRVLGLPVELILETTITPDPDDETGTHFSERFEDARLMGMSLPLPDSWRQSRPLEFSYLDETMLIARGNGGEPHYLKRG